jgi:hypothetical protein
MRGRARAVTRARDSLSERTINNMCGHVVHIMTYYGANRFYVRRTQISATVIVILLYC